MDKKPPITRGDNRLESSQSLHRSVLVGAGQEMFQSGHGLGTCSSSNMTSGAMSNLHPHPPLSPLGAVESNLQELLAHAGSHAQSLNHSSNPTPSDFLASLGEGVLGESSDNHMYHRQLEVPKPKWTTPSKLAPGPFWMLPHHLEPANYTLPGLAVSGTSSPKTSVGPSAVEELSARQLWCERGANQVLMKSEDNVATLKPPMVVKPDRSLLCDGSGAPVDSPKGANGNLISRDASDMEAKQLDSSDCSDHNMDEQEEKDQAQANGGGKTVSKNLVSERKRRKKLNDGLYTLRALVPKISKMDKASIVGDAIDYVRELQKQVEELQADISDIESTKPATGTGREESLSSVVEPSAAQGVEAPTDGRSWEQDGNRTAEAKAAGQEMMEAAFDDTTEQKILELDVAKMEEQTYHLRIFCTKGPGVFVQLMQSLEALGLEIRNANLTSFQENLLNTFIAEIKDWEMMKTEEVKKAILDVAARFGLQP